MKENYFYAGYVESDEIAIFKTKEKRDEWVSYKDQFSADVGCNPDNSFERVALSFDEVEYIINKVQITDDMFDDYLPLFVSYANFINQ